MASSAAFPLFPAPLLLGVRSVLSELEPDEDGDGGPPGAPAAVVIFDPRTALSLGFDPLERAAVVDGSPTWASESRFPAA